MHHHTLRLFNLIKNKELKELYATISIKSFAIALTGIFIPIYLYQIGYSFQSIFIFFALEALFNLLTLYPAARMASRYGLKHSILFSIPFLIIFFLLMYSLPTFGWSLSLLAFFLGTYSSLFWISYHTDFTKSSQKNLRTEQIGFSKIIVSVFGATAPLIGGVILLFFGFKTLFIIVSFLLFASTFPLFLSKEIHEPAKFSFEGFFKNHKLKDALAYIGVGIESRLGAIVWPLFIFIFILEEKYFSLGAVSSIAFVFSLVSILLISKFSKDSKRPVLRAGVILNSIVWFGKSFIITPLQVFVADALYGVSRTSMAISFEAINYDKARKGSRIKKILEREMYIKIGAIIFMLFLAFSVESIVEVFRYGGPLSSLLQFFF